jgi:capsular exopolysaccharide synthesis family protein
MVPLGALNEKEKISLSGDDEQTSLSSAGAPVEISSRPGYPLLVDPGQRAAAEQFGILRSRLLNARSKFGIRSLLVTSPQKRDGKTFTSINLAISLAELQSDRILLVDGDLRLQGITQVLGLEQRSGVADFLQRFSSFQECITATSLPRLYIAPAGNVLGDSLPAILEGSRLQEFLNEAKKKFDFVVVDSVPALAPIADFELLLEACDGALLVVRLRKTAREALDFTVQRVREKVLGVVVNNTDSDKHTDYHSGNYVAKKSDM